MATPGQLVHTVSKVLGIPQATVVQYDRNLVEAGLRTKGGRGLSAARVTSQDAASLLIAIAGAPISGATVKETQATWTRFAPLRAIKVGKPTTFSRLSRSNFPTLGKLGRGHSFHEAIAAVIDSIVAGEFRPWTSAYVSLDSPSPHATISVNQNMIFTGGGIQTRISIKSLTYAKLGILPSARSDQLRSSWVNNEPNSEF